MRQHETINSEARVGQNEVIRSKAALQVFARFELPPDAPALGAYFEVVDAIIFHLFTIDNDFVVSIDEAAYQDIRRRDILVSISLMCRLEIAPIRLHVSHVS